VIKHLPIKHEALSQTPVLSKKKKREREREEKEKRKKPKAKANIFAFLCNSKFFSCDGDLLCLNLSKYFGFDTVLQLCKMMPLGES
jgi:hypothetical protein